jgi:hypothetical protein
MTTRSPRRVAAWRRSTILALALAAIAACTAAPPGSPAASGAAATGAGNTVAAAQGLAGWTDATHGKDAPPDYAAAYPQGKVSAFRIVIEPSDWAAMLADMTKLYGERGVPGADPGGMGGGMRPRGPRPAAGEDAGAGPPGQPAGGPGGPGGRGGTGRTERPMWVPATITYDGRAWTKVGVRFKGNSSLMTAWRGGTDRLPFKLDFDEFDETSPGIEDQRFYGFKQLSLSTNFGDAAHMREAIAYEVLQEAGQVASKTAHYEVFLDHGEGAASLGVYTAIEVTDDTVVERHFGEEAGNIYEGDGPAMSLAEGTRAGLQASFPKENNEGSGWSDLEALYDALHAPTRTTDPAAWRAGLEKVFDTEVFLAWLAIAAVLQHWDTYGGMSHNIYLYDNPANGRLTWISWDHNLVLGASGPGGGGEMPDPPEGAPARGGMGRNASLDRKEVGASWPLIRFLLDDPVYAAKYVAYMKETLAGPFEPTKMQARVDRYAAYLAPYAAGQAEGASGYAAAVQDLRTAIEARVTAVRAFLAP